jgi:outer membrane protein assembly factor BamB
VPVATHAADLGEDAWPQFRRTPDRRGDNPQAALTLPLQRTTAVRLPAPIYASPAVVEGKVYVQDARGHVACIDAAVNRALWVTPIGGFNNTSSPAVASGKVFVGSAAGSLCILDASSGKLLKRVPAEGGVLTAPALANDAVYFSTFAGKLVKIDHDGNVLWTFAGGRISIVEFAVDGRDILFFAGSSNTNFYRLRDEGKEVRVVSKTPAPGACVPMSGPAIVNSERFAFQSFDSEFGRFYVMKDDAKAFTSTDISDSRVVPAVRGNLVYRGDRCFSFDGGLKQLWRVDVEDLYDGGFHSSPALGQDLLVVGCERGIVHFVKLEDKGKVRKPAWQFKTPGAGAPNTAISSSPAVVAGAVYFGGEDGVLYGLSSGEEVAVADAMVQDNPRAVKRLTGPDWPTPGGDMGFSFVSPDLEVKPPFAIEWKTRIWSVFKAPMIVADGKVFCGGRLGNLTALDAASGEILWKFHHPGVESRPGPTYADGKLVILRVRNNQGDSPYVSGASGGPAGEGLWCHDPATGKVLWHRPLSFKYQFNHDGLAVHKGLVFVEHYDKKNDIHLAAYALDTGREVWRRPLTEFPQPAGVKKALKLPPRFSGVIAGGLWCVSISDRGTLALEPETGKTVWSNPDLFITNRTRIGAKGDTLVVFTDKGDFAVHARDGKSLWKGGAAASRYSQALTDRFMESKGQEGIYPPAVCAWPVYANGHWYSHHSFAGTHGSNKLACLKDTGSADVGLLNPKMVVWSFDFISNACPAPSPAYGRLYYSPASEGVIYSFKPTAKK